MPGLEERYIRNLDQQPPPNKNPEHGLIAEQTVIDFYNQMGLETRFSTRSEDEGKKDIGPKQIIDAVSYLDGKPRMAIQITENSSKKVKEKKLQEMRDHPFLRLPEMQSDEIAVPRILVFLDRNKDAALQILDTSIMSLKYDLTQTKNPLEQKAVTELITLLEKEKKKYIH